MTAFSQPRRKSRPSCPNTVRFDPSGRIVWTRRYLRQLEQIGDYISERSPRGASRIVNTIHAKTARILSDNPFAGRPGEIKGTRELVVTGTPYIVAYRVTDAQIDILFVQHGARQWPDEA